MALEYSAVINGACGKDFTGSITLIITGGTPPYTIDWQNPNLGVDIGVLSSTRSGLSGQDYLIRVSDITSPTNEFIYITLPIKDNVCCSIQSVFGTKCNSNNGSVIATTDSVGSVSNYKLFNFDGVLIESLDTSSQTVEFVNISAGTYYIVATNNFGCSGASETFVINDSNVLNFGLYVVPNASCGIGDYGKIFVTGLTGTPPYSYMWSNGGTGDTITGLSEGNYSVQVTDFYGCTKIETAVVELADPMVFLSVTQNLPTCLQNNGSLTFNITGGTPPFYYYLSNGFNTISYSRTLTINNLYAGTYGLDITDSALCKLSLDADLYSVEGMTYVEVFVTNTQCSSQNGSILITTEGGVSPYTYTLIYPTYQSEFFTTPSTNHLFSNLSDGTYTVILSDASGCTFTREYDVVTQSVFSIETSTTSSTFGRPNGSISVIKSDGGRPPFSYVLDGKMIYKNVSLNEVTFEGVSAGQHEIGVYDSNDCFETKQVVVVAEPIMDFFLHVTSDGSFSGNSLTALISSGVPPFTYIWSDNVPYNPQQIYATGLTAGTYSLTIVDSNNSLMKQSIQIGASRNFISYEVYTVGSEEFQVQNNTKYSLSKMMNEGFQDITSGLTGCFLSSATFTAEVVVLPFGTTTQQQFFVSNSLLVSPSDNLWFLTIKQMILDTIGVEDVIIDETNNTITIISDPSRNDIIAGDTTAINIKVNLIIDYDIYCTG